jgi:ribosome-binding protein aMBF1 (putative translation factor)
MQDRSATFQDAPYGAGMQKRRPPKHTRSPLGERIVTFRERAGLSQQQLTNAFDVNQQMIVEVFKALVAQ